MATNVIDPKVFSGSILDAFLPKKDSKTTTTQTQTDKTDLSEEAINEIIRSMQEGDSGLATLMQGQAGRGLYNSSSAQLLANDLAARVGGKAALASAPTTKTATATQKSPGSTIDPKWALGLQLVGELFGGGAKSNTAGGTGGNLGGAFDSIKNSDFISSIFGTSNKDKEYDPFDTYGGFGFTDQNAADFSLGGFNPGANLSLGSSGSSYSYNPMSLTGGSDWLFGTGSTAGAFTGSSYAPSSGSNFSTGFGSTGLGSSGINIGWSF